MPPKRQRPSTPPLTKKKSKGKTAQPSIQSFFSSPSKPKVAGDGAKAKRDQSVISISDSDEEVPKGGDESMAQRLAVEWEKEDEKSAKGKGKAVEEDDDIVAVDSFSTSREGINGSSSSKSALIFVKEEPRAIKSEQPVAAIFAKPQPITPPGSPLRSVEDVKPIVTPTKGGTITSTTAEPVEAIDFDSDAFLFRPESIDTSHWPKGRLPYSILVGVYVQVSSTRSRLLIVRVLTK